MLTSQLCAIPRCAPSQANLSGDSIALTFKANPFLLSYTKTMIDELNPDGSSVDTAPSVRYGGRPGDISWTPATIALPYAMYKVDGDAATAKYGVFGCWFLFVFWVSA